MKHNVTVTIEKQDSKFIPFRILSAEWDKEAPLNCEDLYLVEHDESALPDLDFKLEIGDRLEFNGDFCAEYSQDYFGEHDIHFYFDNVKDITIWRVVHEQEKA